MTRLVSEISAFWKNEDGATAVEYALMVAFIATAIVGVVTLLGAKLGQIFTQATTWF